MRNQANFALLTIENRFPSKKFTVPDMSGFIMGLYGVATRLTGKQRDRKNVLSI